VIHITFKPNPPIDRWRIIELVQKNKHIKLAGNDKLRIEKSLVEVKDRAQMVRDVLRRWGSRSPKSKAAPAAQTAAQFQGKRPATVRDACVGIRGWSV
jgi:transcription-repair coupling factor (superfamily II helicase)